MINYITGASGFIGRRLNALLPDAIPVPRRQIRGPLQPFERLFFLSAYGNMAHQKDARKTFEANVIDLGHLLAESFNGGLFIYVSSSSVGLPVKTMYAQTKLAGEAMVKASGIPACIVRPFSITGVSEQKEHLIPTLIRSCMDGEPMKFAPDPVHDFVDVEDVALELRSIRGPGVSGLLTYEFGSGIGHSNKEVKSLVEKACGRKANVEIVSGKLRNYDTADWVAKNPNMTITKTLEQSISEMVEDYRATH